MLGAVLSTVNAALGGGRGVVAGEVRGGSAAIEIPSDPSPVMLLMVTVRVMPERSRRPWRWRFPLLFKVMLPGPGCWY